jgi:hypothetical protein
MNEWVNVVYLIPGRNQNDFPVDVKLKSTPCPISFTNQIIQLLNLMAFKYINYGNGLLVNKFDASWTTYVDLFRSDHTTGDMCLSSSIFDFNKMNKLHRYNFHDIIYLDKMFNARVYIFYSPLELYRKFPNLFETASKEIIFNELFYDIGHKISEEKKTKNIEVNLAHIRIGTNFKNLLQSINAVHQYDEIVNKYYETIVGNFDIEKPLCVLVDDVNHELIGRLEKKFNLITVSQDETDKHLPVHFRCKYDIRALCDITWALSLNVDKLCIQVNDDNVSTFSIFLKNILNYKKLFTV